ncbi:hypothetical protein BOTBODRAFT_122825 [Botryobasidium botryosum FD-172 SS1]|uniref:tRNA-dihydrouridine(47) synthase [NAD(P)(+)] n=1 Tax=Botryobasidium botryosum (strain FD-172 SS1) TaxID=930990 RepID=A0A067MZW7_BOTB1|nr:hypothetical protein BOTBODRAFT_122825 [Botryobasidium botryosum FD-172 SS1]
MSLTRSNGEAPVKAEYRLPIERAPAPDDDAAEASCPSNAPCPEGSNVDGEPPQKKPRVSGAQRKKQAREAHQAKKERGANKGRRFAKVREDGEICWKVACGETCGGSDCRFTHNIPDYLATKPDDIFFPLTSSIVTEPPFVNVTDTATISCPVFLERGKCDHGYKCRFLSGHISPPLEEGGAPALVRDDALSKEKEGLREANFITNDTLKKLRTKKFPTPLADAYIQELSVKNNAPAEASAEEPPATSTEQAEPTGPESTVHANGPMPEMLSAEIHQEDVDAPDVAMRPSEKKRLRWEGLNYLAPLTTVGNLPFRRLCSTLGAQITCSEMSLATSLLTGSKEEWSLVRRHPIERIYGVQVAGNKPATLARAAEVLQQTLGYGPRGGGNSGGIDFVDLNCGCPIDLVFRTGAGSALLDATNKLGNIIMGMNRGLGEIPLTIKVRTGVKEGKNTAHKLMERLDGWNVGAVTIHGRTRQQRYTKLADWGYIKQCVDTLRASVTDDDLPPIPIFGGGDVYSSEQYWSNVEQTGVDGIMLGRGALIKPWIFTEINERREWDISSRERLELIRKYAEFGLSHWGTDTVGVNTTRRYLCEALSFQYRYIPIGLLETLPGQINDRAPAYRGRDELETLLASPDSRDWVKISEMFLGPCPDGWTFTPKHKSNSYSSEEANG